MRHSRIFTNYKSCLSCYTYPKKLRKILGTDCLNHKLKNKLNIFKKESDITNFVLTRI